MRVSLCAQVSLKDRPPEYRGITNETANIGKVKEVGLDTMIIKLISWLAGFYTIFTPHDVLNDQLDEIANFCQHVRFKPNPDLDSQGE